MSSFAFEYPVLIGIWFAVAAAIWKVSDRAEKVGSDDLKTALSRWLKDPIAVRPTHETAQHFCDLFDIVFTTKFMRPAFFFRSVLASTFAVIVIACAWLALAPLTGEIAVVQLRFSPEIAGDTVTYVGVFVTLFILVFPIFFNWGPDYISLVETRLILRRVVSNRISLLTALILDLSFTICIGITGLLVGLSFIGAWTEGELSIANFMTTLEELGYEGLLAFGSVYFLSTFFTSVWLWLFGLAAVLIKAKHLFGFIHSKLQWALDIDRKPFAALAVYCNLIVSLIMLSALLSVTAFKIFGP